MNNTADCCNTPHAHTGFAGLGFTMAVALPCTLALALGTAANAGVYKTTYILNAPYTDSTPNATQVVVNWSTNLTSGLVQQSDLTNWSIGLYGAGNVFYTDNVITGGTVQSNVGVARGIADVLFQFNLDTGVAGDFDNMLAGITLSSAVGMAYNIYSYPTSTPAPPLGPVLGIWRNGDESTRQLPGYLSVSTVAVPAPSAIALLGMAGLIGRRRR